MHWPCHNPSVRLRIPQYILFQTLEGAAANPTARVLPESKATSFFRAQSGQELLLPEKSKRVTVPLRN
eukprot:g51348.t1